MERALPLVSEEVFDAHLLLLVGELLTLQPLDGFLGAPALQVGQPCPGLTLQLRCTAGVHLHRGRIVRRAQVLGYVVAVVVTRKYLQFTGAWVAGALMSRR